MRPKTEKQAITGCSLWKFSRLNSFSDAGKVANEGDPQLKAAADTELYEIEKRAIQTDTEKYEYENSSGRTDDINYSQGAENDYYQPNS